MIGYGVVIVVKLGFGIAEIFIHHMDWAIQDWAPGGCRWGQLEADKLIR